MRIRHTVIPLSHDELVRPHAGCPIEGQNQVLPATPSSLCRLSPAEQTQR